MEFQRCEFCPLKKTGGLCNAIRPLLPIIEEIDKYVSYDEVVAIYRDEKEVHICNTTMQQALKYVSIMGMIQYCQYGQKYKKCFWNIIPISAAEKVAMKIFLNIFWLESGEKREVEKTIEEFREKLDAIVKNQMARLRLVCKQDALLNAFYNTSIIPVFLEMNIEETMQKEFGIGK